MPNSSFDNNFLPFKSITSIIFHRVRYRSLLLLTCSFRGYDKGAAGPRSTHVSPSASAVPLTSLSTAGPPFQDATRLIPILPSYFRHCILHSVHCGIPDLQHVKIPYRTKRIWVAALLYKQGLNTDFVVY